MTHPYSVATEHTFDLYLSTSAMLSLNKRTHYRVRHATEKRLQGYMEHAADVLGTWDEATLVVRVWHPDGRRRDVHNLMPTVKPLVDGLVLAGVLPDDNDEHLLGPFLVAERERSGERGVTRIRLELTPGLEGVVVGRRGRAA